MPSSQQPGDPGCTHRAKRRTGIRDWCVVPPRGASGYAGLRYEEQRVGLGAGSGRGAGDGADGRDGGASTVTAADAAGGSNEPAHEPPRYMPE